MPYSKQTELRDNNPIVSYFRRNKMATRNTKKKKHGNQILVVCIKILVWILIHYSYY